MALRDINGNRRVIQRLAEAVRTETVSHAYLFVGDTRVDKKRLAREFAKAVLCGEGRWGDACDSCVSCRKMDHGNYEDFIEIGAEGSSIKDEAILALQGRLGKKPYAGQRHIAVISDADTMTLRAQNRLLKTLEEPAPGTVIMLLSENEERLAATILSRCILFRLYSGEGEGEEEGGVNPEGERLAKEFVRLVLEGGAFYQLSAALGEASQKKELAYDFLDSLERRFRDMAVSAYDKEGRLLYHLEDKQLLKDQRRLLKPERLAGAVQVIEEARRDLDRNINVGYTLRAMILKM